MKSPTSNRMRVASALASMHGEPRVSSAWTSQLLAGDVVDVLESRNEWLRVRGADDYEGWVHQGYLAESDGTEGSWRVSLGCDVRVGESATSLPLLARLSPATEVIRGNAIGADELSRRFPRDAGAMCESARVLFSGASYVWGGVSPWGCDCSGFTQSIFRLHGVRLPRDASQQAVALGPLDRDTAIEQLERASLAFFSDRDDQRITHVGIMIGNARMAHSGVGRGGFRIESLDARSDPYVERLRGNFVGSAATLRWIEAFAAER